MAMARLAELPYGVIDQLQREFGRRFGARELQKLHENPDAWDVMLAAVRREHQAFQLIHDVFESQDRLGKMLVDQLRECGIDEGRFAWLTDTGVPCFTDDHEVAVALVPSLDTPEQTHSFLVKWLSEVLGVHLQDHVADSRFRFRYVNKGSFKPWTIRWVRIKLDTHKGKHYGSGFKVKSSFEPHGKGVDIGTLAGLEVLAAMAQHPEVLWARNGEDRPNFCLMPFDLMKRSGHDPDMEALLLMGGDNPRITSVSVSPVGRWPQGLSFPTLV
ncbi:MAG: hypothetical protein HQ488_01345 [Parcubacteria group bacterium]|nr:hypothetical protein [Parcubacteria group bacterium]